MISIKPMTKIVLSYLSPFLRIPLTPSPPTLPVSVRPSRIPRPVSASLATFAIAAEANHLRQPLASPSTRSSRLPSSARPLSRIPQPLSRIPRWVGLATIESKQSKQPPMVLEAPSGRIRAKRSRNPMPTAAAQQLLPAIHFSQRPKGVADALCGRRRRPVSPPVRIRAKRPESCYPPAATSTLAPRLPILVHFSHRPKGVADVFCGKLRRYTDLSAPTEYPLWL